jgi:hypothetical protein
MCNCIVQKSSASDRDCALRGTHTLRVSRYIDCVNNRLSPIQSKPTTCVDHVFLGKSDLPDLHVELNVIIPSSSSPCDGGPVSSTARLSGDTLVLFPSVLKGEAANLCHKQLISMRLLMLLRSPHLHN